MALTEKALAYLALSYGFIGLALLLREPSITAFVITIALLLFYSAVSSRAQIPRLSILRELNPRRSFGGESIDVTVQVTNASERRIDNLQLEDRISHSLTLEAGTNVLHLSMGAGEQVEFTYRIFAPQRGTYPLGPMGFRTSDLLGFRDYKGEISGQDILTILPRVEELGPVELRARRVGPWPGMVPSRRIGIGTDFFELRPYGPGDELKRINWKASAKQAKLIANEFEGEQVTDVVIVLDCSEGITSKLFDFDAAEFEISLAASLCSQLILQGNRVGLSVYGSVRTWVDPAFGKRHLLKILDSLAVVKAGRATLPMDYAVESVIVTVVPAKSVIVFISPLLGNAIVDIITNIAARGYSLLCITPTVNSTAAVDSDSMRLAKKILAAERRNKMTQVAKVAKLIELSPAIPIRPLLRRKTWRTV